MTQQLVDEYKAIKADYDTAYTQEQATLADMKAAYVAQVRKIVNMSKEQSLTAAKYRARIDKDLKSEINSDNVVSAGKHEINTGHLAESR